MAPTSTSPTFTYAVVGHDEQDTLANALKLAFDAARPGDEVWFVDSASTDASVEVARGLGAEVRAAPLGKGRAMAVAFTSCRTDFVCFLDGDLEHAERNIAAELRDGVDDTGADMVVAEFREPNRRLAVTPSIYHPLLRSLFPDLVDVQVAVPLSGFRAVRRRFGAGLPPGYGAETHLNLAVPLAGGTVANREVGLFRGKLRGYANIPPIGIDVAAAMLDLAEQEGRLAGSARPAWDAWVDAVVAVLRRQPPVGAEDAAYVEELLATAARPLPSPT